METRVTSIMMVERALLYHAQRRMMTEFQKRLVDFIYKHEEEWKRADHSLKRAIADVAVWHAL